MKRRSIPFFLSLALAGGCDGAEPAVDEEAIQGGSVDRGDSAVGLLWFTAGGYCSGSLIAPDVVLTAAHCVQDPIAAFYTGTGRAASQLHVPTGMTEHAVDDQVAHPGYRGASCPSSTLDLGLVHLAAPIDHIAPLAFNEGPPPHRKTSCKVIGFGVHTQAGSDHFMQKRSAVETVGSETKTALEVMYKTGIADHGDSGGPLVCNRVIAGTASCHSDGTWPDHQRSYVARVDAGRAWIQATLKKWQR